MSYVISCCSTADVSPAWLEDKQIYAVYFNYNLGGRDLKDDFGNTTPPAELYRRMLEGEKCTTSQVSPAEYLAHWQPFLSQGQDVVHVCLSSGISGTYASACIAQKEAQDIYPDVRVYVIDSLLASSGVALLLDRAAGLRDAGMSAQELYTQLLNLRRDVHTTFISTDLRFYIMGGRISKAAGKIGGLLNVCPTMTVNPDGTLGVTGKVRGKSRGLDFVVKDIIATAKDGPAYTGPLYISNSECIDDVHELISRIKAQVPNISTIEVFDIGATIGVHTGPGTIAVFWWKA